MSYKITVKPPHERERIIRAQCERPLRKYRSYDVYEGEVEDLDVIRIPIDVPVYRISNGRTQTAQMAYVAEKKLPRDYFPTGEENETVQQVQHAILWDFAQQDSKSVTAISEVLEQEKQREPILITPKGIIVNGNRRVAAMRELLDATPEFATVECAVLPNLTPDQVVEIEVRLQMRPETKLDYGWVDACLMIQRLLNSGKKEEQAAHLMRIRPKDVRASISALKEADIYLRDWLKAPGDYRQISDDEQFFYDLPKRLANKSGDLLEASRRIAWILVQNSRSLGQRVYAFNAMFGERAEEVLSRLSERVDLDSSSTKAPPAKSDELEVDLGEPPARTFNYRPLVAELDNPARREEMRDELVAVCQTILDSTRTEQVGKAALYAVRDANTRLAEIDLTKAAPETYDAIDRQLEEVLRRAGDLREKLQRNRAVPPTKS